MVKKLITEESIQATLKLVADDIKGHTHIDGENLLINGDCTTEEIPALCGIEPSISVGANVYYNHHNIFSIGSNLSKCEDTISYYAINNVDSSGNGLEAKNYMFSFSFFLPTDSVLTGSQIRIEKYYWTLEPVTNYEEGSTIDELYGGTFPRNKWVDLVFPVEFPDNTYTNYRGIFFEWENTAETFNYFYIDDLKLERGKIATPFTKSPYDAFINKDLLTTEEDIETIWNNS